MRVSFLLTIFGLAEKETTGETALLAFPYFDTPHVLLCGIEVAEVRLNGATCGGGDLVTGD